MSNDNWFLKGLGILSLIFIAMLLVEVARKWFFHA